MVDAITIFMNVYSLSLLLFSFFLVMTLIVLGDTKLSSETNPIVAGVLLYVSLIWLSMVEGSQAALVGLVSVDPDLYYDSHPFVVRILDVAHEGENLDRFLLGRQFMVTALIYVINWCGTPIEDSSLFNIPDMVIKVFLGSFVGFALVFITATTGQLNAVVNASHCMLDFINNYFCLFTVYVAMMIEASGILHLRYLVQYFLSILSGRPIESREEPRTLLQEVFFWIRVLFSWALLVFSLWVTILAILEEKTTMIEGTSGAVSVALLFVFLSLSGLLEGMQIAFFAVAKLPEEQRQGHPMAERNFNLLFLESDGKNVSDFLVGRQFSVTLCFLIAARLSTMAVDVDAGDETILGVSEKFQELFNTGLLGALVTTILGSVVWQLVASAFPVAFLSNPMVYVLLRWCLLVESTGICSVSWLVANLQKKVIGYLTDDIYIGTMDNVDKHDQDNDANENSSTSQDYIETGELSPTWEDRIRSIEKINEIEDELREQQRSIEERLKILEKQRNMLAKG